MILFCLGLFFLFPSSTFLAAEEPQHQTVIPSPTPQEEKELHFVLGITKLQEGDWEAAQKSLTLVTQEYILIDYRHYFLGEAYYQQGKFTEALKYFQKLYLSFSSSVWQEGALEKVALSNFQLKNYKRAIYYFKKYQKLYPRGTARYKIFYFWGQALENLAEPLLALNIYKNIIIHRPFDEYAKASQERTEKITQKNFLTCLSEQQRCSRAERIAKKDPLQAIQEYKTLINESGNDSQALKVKILYRLVSLYSKLEQIPLAYETIEEIKKIAESDRTYNQLFYLALKEKDEQKAHAYYAKLLSSYPQSRYIASLTAYLARYYLVQEDYLKAEKFFQSLIDLGHHSYLPQAIWSLGWLYYKEQEYELANYYFSTIIENFERSEYYLNALFWQAQTLWESGEQKKAKEIFIKLNQKAPFSFYSLLASDYVGEEGLNNKEKNQKGKNLQGNFPIKRKINFSRGKYLTKLGFKEWAAKEFNSVVFVNRRNKKLIYEIAQIFLNQLDNFNRAYYLAEIYLQPYLTEPISPENYKFFKLAFPPAYQDLVQQYAQEFNLDPWLIWALMRTESKYNPHALSGSNAIGLMQIIPPTGHQIAQELDIKNFSVEDLYNPKTSIYFACYYLDQLFKRFNNNILLAIPGYNAGPHRISTWLSNKKTIQFVEFIEKIPFSETRDYVKKVIKNWWIYKQLYSSDSNLIKINQAISVAENSL